MIAPMRLVTDDERRARLAIRHALAPAAQVDSPEAAVRAMTVLHATEPATVYLSCQARHPAATFGAIDQALYDDRSIVKQLAMRRTLFVFPRDLVGAAWSSASARVAGTERARMAKEVERAGLARDGNGWIDQSQELVLALLAATPDGLTATEIRQAIPMLDVKVVGTPGEVWSVSKVLTVLGAQGDIMRGTNTGPWYTSRPRWVATPQWVPDVVAVGDAATGYRELVRRWLYRFGPGTEDDLVWWLGSTKAIVRAALADVDAVPVALADGSVGWLLPDDCDEVRFDEPWVALLPVLDPTTMGWKGRDFYLGGTKDQIFDRNGNAGTTAWVGGRVVGAWTQDSAGVVRVHALEALRAGARAELDRAATRLTEWLDGHRVGIVYQSPLMKAARSAPEAR